MTRATGELIEELNSSCPFCGHDPYHYVDNGVGMEAVAVTCCENGIALFQHGDEGLSRARGLMFEAATALSAQEAEIERLKAKVERYEARLEIDHCYVMAESGDELERRDVPAEERETWPDGITCRDETIRLLEEQIAALPAKGEG